MSLDDLLFSRKEQEEIFLLAPIPVDPLETELLQALDWAYIDWVEGLIGDFFEFFWSANPTKEDELFFPMGLKDWYLP